MTIFVEYGEHLPADVVNDGSPLKREKCCIGGCGGEVAVEATGYPAFCRKSLGRTFHACKEHSTEAFIKARDWAREKKRGKENQIV